MSKDSSIKVTSHVSRDFLQNAAYFNTLPKIVWEYVANSLDAAKEGVQAIVAVEITSRYVTISDNGRGMSRSDLHNFFQMHGENVQRKLGKRVRGRFGTGKSAAFGLANRLRIDSTQSRLRNVVELNRSDIEAVKGEAFPVNDIIKDAPVDNEDGTTVEIREFNIKSLDVDRVISYVERHLSRYRQRAHVTINGHECKFSEPTCIEIIRKTPPVEVGQHIGNVELIVKVSPLPLDEETKGIDILSYGIWHGTTLAGVEKKERANYLFGEVDVPILEDGEWAIPAFDNTRNNTLNPQNPVVVVLLGWLAEELEFVRTKIVEQEKQRRRSETAKQLEREAERIAEVLNEDFAQQEFELELARRVADRRGKQSIDEMFDENGEILPGNGSMLSQWQETGSPHGNGNRGDKGGDGDISRPGPGLKAGNQLGTTKKSNPGKKKNRKAVFSLEYENATSNTYRSRYDANTKTIYINLDHPQIASAFDSGGRRTDNRQFREICYEVAVVEYAIALPYEKLEKTELHASEVLWDVKDTINRLIFRFIGILNS